MIEAGKRYMERFLRPALFETDPRLTDLRCNLLKRAEIIIGILKDINDDVLQLQMIRTLRLASSSENSTLFSQFTRLMEAEDILPKISPFLHHPDDEVKNEVIWLYANIAAGSSNGCKALLENTCIRNIITIFPSVSYSLKENIIWTISNVCAEGDSFLNHVWKTSFPSDFLSFLNSPNLYLTFIQNTCWAITNIYRNKFNGLDLPQQSILINFLYKHLLHIDTETKSSVLFLFSRMLEVDRILQYAMGIFDLKIFFNFLKTDTPISIQVPTVRIFGAICSGSDECVDKVLETGEVPVLLDLLVKTESNSLTKEILWALSNISAGTVHQKELLIQFPLFSSLEQVLLQQPRDDILRETSFVVSNLFSNASPGLLVEIIDQKGIEMLGSLLTNTKGKDVLIVLEGIENVLASSVSMQLNLPKKLIDLGIVEKIEELQLSPLANVYEKAQKLLETFFETESNLDELLQ